MKVELAKRYPLPASGDVAWAFLQDIEAVAACMPGANIVERIDPSHFKGTVSVKVGPASMAFRGTIELRDVDAATRSLRLISKGTDSTGSSGASMDLLARIDAVDAHTSTLVGTSAVSMSGRAATFGGRMLNTVADQVLEQFADNFALRVAALEAERATPAAAASAARADATIPPPTPTPTPPSAPPAANEINGLAFAWAVLKDWLRGLFGGKKA